jgi:HlyD family secretion protein
LQIVTIFTFILLALGLGGCFDSKENTHKFYGNVDVRTVSLSFRVSGRVESIFFDEGQKVKKGETIAKLDDSLFIEYLNQINAQIAMQEATIAKLERGYREEEIAKAKAKATQSQIEKERLQKEFERVQKLHEARSISTQKFDDIYAAFKEAQANHLYAKSALELLQNGYDIEDIASAKAQLDALKAQKNLHKINLDDTSLIAPNDGIIITRIYEAGSIVTPTQAVVEIAKDDEYWVRSYMSEKYLGTIKIGQKAKISTDNGKIFEGKVSFISPMAEFTPKTVQTEELRSDLVYRFRIILQKYDETIKQGMPVTITFDDL